MDLQTSGIYTTQHPFPAKIQCTVTENKARITFTLCARSVTALTRLLNTGNVHDKTNTRENKSNDYLFKKNNSTRLHTNKICITQRKRTFHHDALRQYKTKVPTVRENVYIHCWLAQMSNGWRGHCSPKPLKGNSVPLVFPAIARSCVHWPSASTNRPRARAALAHQVWRKRPCARPIQSPS